MIALPSLPARAYPTLIAILILATGCMTLAGCQSTGPATPEQIQAMANTCQQYGFKTGTAEFANCVAALDARRFQEAQLAADRRLAASNALMAAGAAQQSSRLNCQTIRVGQTLQTNCF